jgi:hypothetical protein
VAEQQRRLRATVESADLDEAEAASLRALDEEVSRALAGVWRTHDDAPSLPLESGGRR